MLAIRKLLGHEKSIHVPDYQYIQYKLTTSQKHDIFGNAVSYSTAVVSFLDKSFKPTNQEQQVLSDSLPLLGFEIEDECTKDEKVKSLLTETVYIHAAILYNTEVQAACLLLAVATGVLQTCCTTMNKIMTLADK